MRAVIQRVKKAQVKIKEKIVSKIGRGLLVFLAIRDDDTEEKLDWLAEKVANLRIMADEQDKMNLSVLETKGEILVVSQFTLYGDCQKGRRPSFVKAAEPKKAQEFYNLFIKKLKNYGLRVKEGIFGARMQVELINDGPVTIIIEK